MKKNYQSLKNYDKAIETHLAGQQKEFKYEQEQIMYPKTSMLDDFMKSQGLSKQLGENFKLINGQIEFVSNKKPKQRMTKNKNESVFSIT